MRWITGTIWRWFHARNRKRLGGSISPTATRLPSRVDWSRFAGSLRIIETTRLVNSHSTAATTRIIRELRTVRSIEQPDLSELRKVEAVLNSVNLQLENAIRTAM